MGKERGRGGNAAMRWGEMCGRRTRVTHCVSYKLILKPCGSGEDESWHEGPKPRDTKATNHEANGELERKEGGNTEKETFLILEVGKSNHG